MKFTSQGGVTVQASVKRDGAVTKLTLSVQDTGIGIPEEARPRMFKAFSQAEKTTSRRFGGTGLGLSISKRLVEMMKGTLSFESVPQEGSTFFLNLELKTGNQFEKTSLNKSEISNEKTRLAGRVLVAEDNIVNQKVVGRMLDLLGCKHRIVSNGQEALDALKASPYDLVLMDCQMPIMDGYEASEMIRGCAEPLKSIPIVALTANAVQGDDQKCFKVGMTDYLSKPIDKAKLEKVLRKYLVPTQILQKA